MKPSRASRKCMWIVLSLLIAITSTACKPNSMRPETVPTAPLVVCAPSPPLQLSPIPELWLLPIWAVETMAKYEDAAVKIWASIHCESDLRKRGVIR